jgi:glutaredoxin
MIQIYSKPGCDYCDMAKEFLDERFISFMYIIVENQDDVEALKLETGHHTFPFVFDDGVFIGGLKELMLKYDCL